MATKDYYDSVVLDPLARSLRNLFVDIGDHAPAAPPFAFPEMGPMRRRRLCTSTVPLAGALLVAALVFIGVRMVRPDFEVSETVVITSQPKTSGDGSLYLPEPGPLDVVSRFQNQPQRYGRRPWASYRTFGYTQGEIGDLVFPAFVDSRRTRRPARVLDPGLPILPRFVGRAGDTMQIRDNQVYRNGQVVWTREPNEGESVADSLPHVVPKGAVALVPEDLFVVPVQNWWQIRALPLKVEATHAIVMAAPVASTLALLSEPNGQATPSATIDLATAIGFPATLLVTDEQTDFVQVLVPSNLEPFFKGLPPPNKRAWVRVSDVRVFETSDLIEINVAKRTLTASIGDNRLTTSIAVPRGDVVESTKGRFQIFSQRSARNSDGVFGPGELRLTARSPRLKTYMGDDPYFVSIQGTNTPSSIGRAVTNGNFRLNNSVWLRLAKLPIGTLVIIR